MSRLNKTPSAPLAAAKTKMTPRTASARLLVIMPMVEFRQAKDRPVLLHFSRRSFRRLSDVVRWRARLARVSQRTIWRWWSLYQHGGPDALADRPRRDKGRSIFFRHHADHRAFVEARVHSSVSALLKAMHRAGLSPLPAASTLRAYLKSLSAATRAARLARRRAQWNGKKS